MFKPAIFIFWYRISDRTVEDTDVCIWLCLIHSFIYQNMSSFIFYTTPKINVSATDVTRHLFVSFVCSCIKSPLLEPDKLLWQCIHELRGSNSCRDTSCYDSDFSRFSSAFPGIPRNDDLVGPNPNLFSIHDRIFASFFNLHNLCSWDSVVKWPTNQSNTRLNLLCWDICNVRCSDILWQNFSKCPRFWCYCGAVTPPPREHVASTDGGSAYR
jgi:hypothetical protein